jgi:hypothetical protein
MVKIVKTKSKTQPSSRQVTGPKLEPNWLKLKKQPHAARSNPGFQKK